MAQTARSGAPPTSRPVPVPRCKSSVMPAAAYRQNMMFHRNAFALVMVPMVKPPGAVDVARESYKGTSVRVIPYYDGTNDV